MEAVFQNCKNGEKTVILNGFLYHSAYNPTKEAERFVQNLTPPFLPEIIFITEPGLSYCASFLKAKYPETKIVAVRFSSIFSDYDCYFDEIINFYEFNFNQEHIENFLFYKYGEISILLSFFCSWTLSPKVFPQMEQLFWNCIKNITEKAKTLLITSQFFETKWFKNSLNFFKYINNPIKLSKKIDIPVCIIASGPSLQKAAAILQKNQNNFFIIALSSSITFCLENNIIPDLCISTDGGYWAGEHLKKLAINNTKRKIDENLVLAITPESYCKKSILHSIEILPLNYEDGISSKLSNQSDLSFFTAKRNGTVSGTALQFAIQYSSKEIFFFGLDLACNNGYQHANPNELQTNSHIFDYKINSLEKKVSLSQFSSASLKIYENWFSSFNIFNRNIFRIIDENDAKNKLGQIKDISVVNFKSICDNLQKIEQKESFFEKQNVTVNKENIINELKTIFFNDDVKKQFYPLDFILYKHTNNTEILNKIEKKHKELYDKAVKMFE